MDWVSCALVSFVTLTGLETSVEFNEVWYREVMLGEVRHAATTYDRVYWQMPPWQGSTEDERRLAALRAGLCFERLGRFAEARLAYDWLLQHGLHGSALVNQARARLAEMVRSGVAPREAEPYPTARRDVSLVRDALADLKTVRAEVGRGKRDLESLRVALSPLKDEVRLMRSLRERLQTRGAAVFVGSESVFATPGSGSAEVGGPVAGPSDPPGDFRRSLETELRTILTEGFSFEGILPGVADTFCGAALRAVSTGDIATARRCLEQALALSGHHSAALDFAQKLSARQDSPGLRNLARRYLLEERLRQVGELQAQIRDRIARARQVRRDFGVDLVVQIWQLIDRAPAELRQEAEISYLAREVERLFVSLTAGVSSPEDRGPPGEELRSLLAERERQNETARGLVREIVELTFEKVAMAMATGREARADTLRIVAEELQRLLAHGRNSLAAGSVTECAGAVRQVELLLSWFPGLDPHYEMQRRRLEGDLQFKRAFPGGQKELDSHR